MQAHASNMPPVRVADVQALIGEHYAIHRKFLLSPSREHWLAHARQTAMFFCRRLTRNSYPALARLFDKRDHTTVLHAVRAVARRAEADPKLHLEIDRLERELLDRADRREAATLLANGLPPALPLKRRTTARRRKA